jgi:hypothetical protein
MILHGKLSEVWDSRFGSREADLRDGDGKVHFDARRGSTLASLGQKRWRG